MKTYEAVRNRSNPKDSYIQKEESTKREVIMKRKTSRNDEIVMKLQCFNCGNKGHRASDCKLLAPKCFICNSMGHKSKDCVNEVWKRNNVSFAYNVHTPTNNMIKDVCIHNFSVTALIDTESTVNLILQSIFVEHMNIQLNPSKFMSVGFGQASFKTLGFFQIIVTIGNFELPSIIYVVPHNSTNTHAIIGNDILGQAEILINQDGIRIKKNSLCVFLANFNLNDIQSPNLNHITDCEIK